MVERRHRLRAVLWIAAAALFAFWVIGLSLKLAAALVHLALLAALVLFVIGLFRSRRSAAAP